MEFWPADFRTDASATPKKRRKRKEVYKLNDQCVEPGTLGAATFALGRATPEWITLVQPGLRLPTLVNDPVEVFPPTKPPVTTVPKLSVHQRTEQGTRFLRTYYPDVDIPFEVIKDELQLDDDAAAESILGSYLGNQLAHVCMEVRKKQMHFVAFTSGNTGSELNLSPFRRKQDKGLVFTPSAVPTMSFNTPIQQLAAFIPKDETALKCPFLAVRTHSAVSVLKLEASADVSEKSPPATAKTVGSISIADTGNSRIVDMTCGLFSSSNAHLILVNEMGALYNCRLQGGKKTLSLAPDVTVDEEFDVDGFWRIAWKNTNTCIRISGKKSHIFDLRARTSPPRELFHIKDSGEYLTSLEMPSGDRHMMCFSTTSKLLWFDERNYKRPILSYKHHRAFDRSLRVESVAVDSSYLTTLSSTMNHLVTVYDVNYSSSGLVQFYGEPSILPSCTRVDLPVLGSMIFRHPDDSGLSHFQLSSRGALWKTKFQFTEKPTSPVLSSSAEDFEWSDELHALAKESKTMTEYIGPLGGREYTNANLRRLYEKIFDVHSDPTESAEDPEAVYQTLDKMPLFWQDMNGPAEHMLTTFDVAFQSGTEPLHASRADFLTESLLNSSRGFAALAWGRVPIPRLVSTSRWHHDLASMPLNMVPNLREPSHILVDQMRQEALRYASTPEGMRRVTKASQNLVMDLALGRHIYAPQAFAKSKDKHRDIDADHADVLSEATRAMSLGATKPPPVEFGFLRPMTKVPYDDEEAIESDEDSQSGKPLDISLGVRLLLSQWEVGSDPERYSYKDPYKIREQSSSLGQTEHAKKRPQAQQSTQQFTVPPRPPLIVSSTSRKVVPPQPLVGSSSRMISDTSPSAPTMSLLSDHGVSHGGSQAIVESQDLSQVILGPNTQPLPGPFGGGTRQTGGAKKKAAKKRIGGF